jgi:hypothetical protein
MLLNDSELQSGNYMRRIDMSQFKVIFRISSVETQETHRESMRLPSFQMGFKPDTSQMPVGWISAVSTHFVK